MARLSPKQYQSTGQDTQNNSAPDPVQIVLDGIYEWVRARQHHGPMPAPCPPTYEDTARWWVAKMQEPEQPGETRKVSSSGDSSRWECGYALRCRSSLMQWLALTTLQRNAIAACVLDDKIPYRGDPFAIYVQIVEETLTMRDDPAAYIAAARRLLQPGSVGKNKCTSAPDGVD